jgi:hypothetical protein
MDEFIIKAKGGDYEMPKPGESHVVLSNIYGPFMESYSWKGKTITTEKMIFLFELVDQLCTKGDFAGKRMTRCIEFPASLGEKSKFRPFLVNWAGKDITPEQAAGFNVYKLIGVNGNANLIEKTKQDGGKTVVIVSVNPRRKDQVVVTPELSRSYIPEWVAKKMGMTAPEESAASSPDNFDDDISF